MLGSSAHRALALAMVVVSGAVLTTGPPAAAAVDVVPLATDCWSSDNGLPVVSGVELGAAEVDVRHGPVDVPLRLRVLDTGGPGPATGVRSVSVSVGVAGGSKAFPEKVPVAVAPTPDGWWTGTVTVPAVGYNEFWSVYEVIATDGAGNSRSMVSLPASPAAWSPRLHVIRPANTGAPEVQSFHATRRVDVRKRARFVHVRAHVTDPDQAAAARVKVNGKALHLASGTAHDGWWTGRLLVRPGTARGGHHLNLWMADADLASRSAWWAPLRDHGHDWRFFVRSHPDDSPPVLTRIVAPPSVDVRDSDRTVKVRLHVVDAGRGTKGVTLFRLADARTHWSSFPAQLVSGSRRDGWWVGALPFSRCATNAGDKEVRAILVDRVDNASADLLVASLEKVVGDHRGPSWTVRGFGNSDAGPDGPLVVTFDEPAYGVTPESLVATLGGAPVPASWACTAPGGEPVDCVGGPVRSAQLMTSQRPEPRTLAGVFANPEHNLDLTDALGNPATPRSGGEWYVWPTASSAAS